MPFSTSIQESCFDLSASAPPAPRPSTREQIEQSLRRKFAVVGFDTFTCPDVPPGARSTTCTISAKNGTSTSVAITLLKAGQNGEWQSWNMEARARTFNAERLATVLLKSVQEKRPLSQHLQIDCGSGPQLAVDDKFQCKVTDTKTHRKGTITAQFTDKSTSWNLKL